ncbi:hypothetical protein F7725_022541 [Dissostichus mawsoni]|uniref:Peptidase M10A matrix metallopeptidase C-terminal domain-containing protein n=1 Tax=Dissostichus mawsoni TaxID=36200 RepID=A0A7J5YYJ6_DISMA|nr:hypothetical protein F7725_022541 [Dissostichus mawsoni]
MTLIMVIVPLLLILCILVLIYGILRTLQKKETPRALVHCKRSLQNWVHQGSSLPSSHHSHDNCFDYTRTDNGVKTSAPRVKSPPQKNVEEDSQDSQNQTGVLGWLSNGFVSAMPQPTGSPRLSRSDSERMGESEERSGVLGWVTQGLTKVLPQPDDKYKEIEDTQVHTEIYEVATMPDFDPLPHIPVVEMESEDEEEPEPSLFPPNVVNWIKQMVPQPLVLPPGAVPLEPSTKSSRSSLDKILSPPPESLSGISLDTDGKAPSMVGWFMSGLGLKIPQPAVQTKDDAQGAAEVLKKASSKLRPDMVLEDVDSDNEGPQKRKDQSTVAAPNPSVTTSSTNTQQTQSEPEPEPEPEPDPAPSDSGTKSQEDAETQTGRWTPFIENIKKEAEGVAMASMEERLLQERSEMVLIAEEVARTTAENAIRQMASESIKLSLGSQDLLDEEDEEPDAE